MHARALLASTQVTFASICLACCLTQAVAANVTVRSEGPWNTVFLVGDISEGDSLRLARALTSPSVSYVVLNSPGGSVAE